MNDSPSTHFDPSAPVPEEYDLFCHACGYSLVGLAGDRCPECGQTFAPGDLPYARVPWLHRRRIGRWPAYWGTVRQVVRRPRAFAEEICRPVRISADDARRFRATTTAVAASTFAAAALISVYFNTGPWSWQDKVVVSIFFSLGWFLSVLFFRLATDIPVFIWKGLPSEAAYELAPLHHYATAPLAYVPHVAAVAVGLPALAAYLNSPPWARQVSFGLAALAVAAWIFVCWRTPLVLMRAATGCGRGQVVLLALYLPLHALVMFTLTFLTFMVLMIPMSWFVKYFAQF